jgi:hypothetical protein
VLTSLSPRRSLSLLVASAVGAGVVALVPASPAASSGQGLYVSLSADRSGASALAGQTLTPTNAYIYFARSADAFDASGIKGVTFHVDGKKVRYEGVGPFDLGGTPELDRAGAYDLSTLSLGSHTAVAKVTYTSGGTGQFRSSFTIARPTTTTTAPAPTTTTIAPTTTTTAPAPTTTTTAPAPAISAPIADTAGVLWSTIYDNLLDASSLRPPWQSEQEPSSDGVVQNRITAVQGADVPGGAGAPSSAMRVELRPGDLQSGAYNRAEVYARHAVPGSTPASGWPDPVGSTRWYGLSVFIPADFVESTNWAVITQWKGYAGGSPPVALEVAGGRFVLGSSVASRIDLGALAKGAWTSFDVGIRFAPDANGWVEVWRDGQETVARTSRPTMGRNSDGTPDPTYFKQGMYRSKSWTSTNVVFHAPVRIGLSRSDV